MNKKNMNTSAIEAFATSISFDSNNMWVELADGRKLGVPLLYFPRLFYAAPQERKNYTISGSGKGLHWEELDEDISVKGLLEGIGDRTTPFAAFRKEISEINQDMLRLEREGRNKEADKKRKQLEKMQRGNAAYALAGIKARMGNKKECRRWLLIGQEAGTLPTRAQAMKDSDLDSVKNETWFKEIKWKGER